MSTKHKEEKKRWKEDQMKAAIAALPLPNDELRDLFEHVDHQLHLDGGCDRSLRFSLEWMERRGRSPAPIVEWLTNNAAHCDCQVVMNAWSQWEELQPRKPPPRLPKKRRKQSTIGPPPSAYEDEAIRFSLPDKPWKFQHAPQAGALLELGFGRARLRLLRGTTKTEAWDWCHQRGIELIRGLGIDDAETYWCEYGMKVDELARLAVGTVEGRVYKASSSRRTHLFVWWHMALPAQVRVLELDSDWRRWEGDWREVRKMLGAADLRPSGRVAGSSGICRS